MNLADIFSKHRKLFDSKVAPKETIINEDMGNLAAVDEKFRSMFSDRYGHNKKNQIQNPRVGQNSPVTAVDVVTARQAADMFFGTNDAKSSAQGMILNVDGKQLLAIGKHNGQNYKGAQDYKVILDVPAYKAMEKDTARLAKIAKILSGYDTTLRNQETQDTSLTTASAKTLLNNVFKAAKDSGAKKIDALVVKSDPQRLGKQQQRATAKAGSIPTSGDTIRSGKFAENAKRALWARLEAFKAKKAAQYNTPEEFFAAAMKTGYMEKVNVDGFVYKLDRADLRVGDIVKPDKNWSNQNSIRYRLDTTHSDKLDALRDQVRSMYKAAENDPAIQAKMEELKAKYPPNEINIMMGMQGGSIVPVSVEVGKRENYW